MQELDGAALRRWCLLARDRLAAAAERLDVLNVFPVADADTGTNLALTARAAAAAVSDAGARGLAPTARAAARGALAGARGNSGVIAAAWWQGVARACESADVLAPADLARALALGADRAVAAVAAPVAGTILTAASAAAEAAAKAADKAADRAAAQAPDPVPAPEGRAGALAAVALAAAAAADTAAVASPRNNPALHGVVDAGAAGLAVWLAALAEVVTGERPPLECLAQPDGGWVAGPAAQQGATPRRPSRLPVEVQFSLTGATGDALHDLETTLKAIGESVVVAGDDSLRRVHVHVDVGEVGAALEAALTAGRPSDIAVTPLDAVLDGGRRVVAVASGAGLRRLLADAGAEVVEAHELAALLIEHTDGAAVVLPGDPDVLTVATAAARTAGSAGGHVTVLATRSPVQSLAALAVHDADRPLAADVAAMSAAAGATRWADVVRAQQTAQTMAGICRPDDLLAVVEGDVALIRPPGADVAALALELLDRMLGAGGELVTLLVGAHCPEGVSDAVRRGLASTRPEVDLLVHAGGQPALVTVGVE